jgi:hypothetical protein
MTNDDKDPTHRGETRVSPDESDEEIAALRQTIATLRQTIASLERRWAAQLFELRQQAANSAVRERRFAKEIVELNTASASYPRRYATVDHACARCVLGGALVVEGFVCVFHEAQDMTKDLLKGMQEDK